MAKFKYVVQFVERKYGFGKTLAFFWAVNAEDLAEQFFARYKTMDYQILYKTDEAGNLVPLNKSYA